MSHPHPTLADHTFELASGDRHDNGSATGTGRRGSVRDYSQTQRPNDNGVTRDTKTGRFLDQEQDAKPFNGIHRENRSHANDNSPF